MQIPGHVLATARLALRPVAPSDAAAIVHAVGDWEVLRWLSRARYPYTLADAREFIAKTAEKAGQVWMIEDATGLCGCIGRKREFGYWLAPWVWGKGYATEAGRAVLAHHFQDPAAPDLISGHFDGNARSRAVLDRLGFEPCEDRRVHALSLQREVVIRGMHLTRRRYNSAPQP
jgi:RimJ/RimL family protein N-acetyltransferase